MRSLELAQQHDWGVAGQLDPDADDLHLDHPRTIAPPSPGTVPIGGRCSAPEVVAQSLAQHGGPQATAQHRQLVEPLGGLST